MRILLDTHILIWILDESPELSQKTISLIKSADEVYASTVNIWEIVVKHSMGKLVLDFKIEDLLNVITYSGIEILNIKPEHALKLADLEDIHEDPFDRMLIAQSIVEPLHLFTTDSKVTQYKGNIIEV